MPSSSPARPDAGADDAGDGSDRMLDPGSPKSGAADGATRALGLDRSPSRGDVDRAGARSSPLGRSPRHSARVSDGAHLAETEPEPALSAEGALTAEGTAEGAVAATGNSPARQSGDVATGEMAASSAGPCEDEDDDSDCPAELQYSVVKLTLRGIREGTYRWELKESAQPTACADVESSSGPRKVAAGLSASARPAYAGTRSPGWCAVTAVATELVASMAHPQLRLAVAYTDEVRTEALKLFRDLNHLSLRGGISCERVVMHPSSHTVVLQFKEGLFACAATFDLSENCVMLRLLATHPRMTRHGFGRVVIHFLKELGRALGKVAIVAYTYPNAQTFYEALDFRLTGQLENEMAFQVQRSMPDVLSSLRDLSESHPYACTRRSRTDLGSIQLGQAARTPEQGMQPLNPQGVAVSGASAAKTSANVVRILGRRMVSSPGEGGEWGAQHCEYLVQWSGRSLEEAAWEPEPQLTHCATAVSEFLLREQTMLERMPLATRPPPLDGAFGDGRVERGFAAEKLSAGETRAAVPGGLPLRRPQLQGLQEQRLGQGRAQRSRTAAGLGLGSPDGSCAAPGLANGGQPQALSLQLGARPPQQPSPSGLGLGVCAGSLRAPAAVAGTALSGGPPAAKKRTPNLRADEETPPTSDVVEGAAFVAPPKRPRRVDPCLSGFKPGNSKARPKAPAKAPPPAPPAAAQATPGADSEGVQRCAQQLPSALGASEAGLAQAAGAKAGPGSGPGSPDPAVGLLQRQEQGQPTLQQAQQQAQGTVPQPLPLRTDAGDAREQRGTADALPELAERTEEAGPNSLCDSTSRAEELFSEEPTTPPTPPPTATTESPLERKALLEPSPAKRQCAEHGQDTVA